MFQVGTQVAVRSIASRLPSGWDSLASAQSLHVGADYTRELPFQRWDWFSHYDSNEDGWKMNKHCARHSNYMEGCELFDPKVFGLSVHECRGMDPCQRVILETAYESLHDAGWSKKALMRQLIGVYLGASQSEFVNCPAPEGATGTSCAGAITSNRISFCLGMQGPSFTLDIGAASSLVAAQNAAMSIKLQTEAYRNNHTAICGGIALTLHHNYLILACAQGLICPEGRCFSFDVTAAGWVKGEGSGIIVVDKNKVEMIDGEAVVDDKKHILALVSSGMVGHVGASASLTAPNGPGEQAVISEALRQSGISYLDIDAVECHGDGSMLGDAVEVSSLLRLLRDEELETPLVVGSAKTNMGNCQETAGVVQLLKVIYGALYNTWQPGQHLLELNPHISGPWDGEAILFPTEATRFRQASSFTGSQGRSVSGTFAHVMLWGTTNTQEWMQPRKRVQREGLSFWPQGGGELEEGAEPLKAYSIVGSWSSFLDAEPLRMQDEGVYVTVVTLGPNRYEHFQIRLDDDELRVLHPDVPDAGTYAKVVGPDWERPEGYAWMIDGRPRWGPQELADEQGGTTDESRLRPFEGVPGDKYEVRLRVVGKWRSVEITKLDFNLGIPGKVISDDGEYCIVGDFNNWSFVDVLDKREEGQYETEVKLTNYTSDFIIVRNRDWRQAFFPNPNPSGEGKEEKVLGPDFYQSGITWRFMPGRQTSLIKVIFTRTRASPSDEITVTWEVLSESMSPGLADF
mmetsp:Transcript_89390/g.182283  ORF Transcript_89390/g.182283 Transcript_89390/m.182283 type:complete len:743 (+) Transcript_89390:3-2231(+)